MPANTLLLAAKDEFGMTNSVFLDYSLIHSDP